MECEILSYFWKIIWSNLGTKLFSTTSHPQIDGQNEITNLTFGTLLRVLIRKSLKGWKTCWPIAEFAYNMTVYSTTSHSHFEIVYGFNSLTFLDLSSLPIIEQLNDDGSREANLCTDFMRKFSFRLQRRMSIDEN